MARRPTASAIIKREYGRSTNMITPTVIEYGMVDRDRAYELARGTGIYDEPLYGVSVVLLHDDGSTERLFDQSTCFPSEDDARAHIAALGA